jgi:hypothetical protein
VSDNVEGVGSDTIVSVAATVEILRNALMADDVGHVVLRSVNREERLESFLVQAALIRVLSRTIGSETSGERVRASTNKPATSRAEPGEGVGGNGLVPAVLVVLVQNFDAVVGVLGILLKVVEVHEVGHVHVVVVTNGVVEVTSSRAAINLEERVRATEATGSTEKTKQVVVHVLGPTALGNSEKVATENNTKSGQESRHVRSHTPDSANCSDILGELELESVH